MSERSIKAEILLRKSRASLTRVSPVFAPIRATSRLSICTRTSATARRPVIKF